jgi:hypothetical protein
MGGREPHAPPLLSCTPTILHAPTLPQNVFTAPVSVTQGSAPTSPVPSAATGAGAGVGAADVSLQLSPAEGVWCEVTAPARIDLAGGWSDTPPITLEAPPVPPGHVSDAVPGLDEAAQAQVRGWVVACVVAGACWPCDGWWWW